MLPYHTTQTGWGVPWFLNDPWSVGCYRDSHGKTGDIDSKRTKKCSQQEQLQLHASQQHIQVGRCGLIKILQRWAGLATRSIKFKSQQLPAFSGDAHKGTWLQIQQVNPCLKPKLPRLAQQSRVRVLRTYSKSPVKINTGKICQKKKTWKYSSS